ncbi:MAG: hypothetical protein JO320_04220 [Alphaproteobacteria bacterium]|nr:hypothetical protein [Alphaproteobacteria bacterium]
MVALASPSARHISVNGELHEALAHWQAKPIFTKSATPASLYGAYDDAGKMAVHVRFNE